MAIANRNAMNVNSVVIVHVKASMDFLDPMKEPQREGVMVKIDVVVAVVVVVVVII
jgi:hypothetical protein